MFGTIRPSSSTRAFQCVNVSSSCAGSCPRSANRTGCAESGAIRYWYHETSQATVITVPGFPPEPESSTMLPSGEPRLLAIPPTVRLASLALKRSAAWTSASSSSERRRKIGSATTGSGSSRFGENRRRRLGPRLRRRSAATVGVDGVPSLSQPYSSAMSLHSGQTSTSSSPGSGANRVARSPISNVRSQIAHTRTTAFRVMCMAGEDSGLGVARAWPVRARLMRFTEPALLLLLSERRAHGYELVDGLEELAPGERVHMGNLYRSLRALEHEGLVSSSWDGEAPGAAKRVYELTDAGGALLAEWAQALGRARDCIDVFLTRYEQKGGDHVPRR